MFVHFPIALVMAAALLDLIVIFGKREKMAVCAGVVWLLALAGGVAAASTGLWAEDHLGTLAPAADKAVDLHETFALITAGLVFVLAAWRLAGKLQYPPGWQKGVYVALIVAAVGLVGYTGFLGGELVYGHAIGQPHAATATK
jgi:uncharacterized membrane protein